MAWNSPGLGKYIAFMWMEGAFFFTLVMLIELRVFRSLRLRLNSLFTPGNAESYTVNVPAEV